MGIPEMFQGWTAFIGVILALAASAYALWRQFKDRQEAKAKEKRDEEKAAIAAASAATNERERLKAEIEAEWLASMRSEIQNMQQRIDTLRTQLRAERDEREALQVQFDTLEKEHRRLLMFGRAEDQQRIAELEQRVAHLEAENSALRGGK